MQNYRKLNVWQSAHCFILDVYEATRHFPNDEKYGLVSQLRRSAASIAMNIAEGSMCSTTTAFARYLEIASCSAAECDCQLLIARDLGYLEAAVYSLLVEQLTSIRRRLSGLRRAVVQASRRRIDQNKPKSKIQNPLMR